MGAKRLSYSLWRHFSLAKPGANHYYPAVATLKRAIKIFVFVVTIDLGASIQMLPLPFSAGHQ